MALERENEALKRQLQTQADARNQEILDLQHHFADQLREIERMKGVNNPDEIGALKQRFRQLEERVSEQTAESAALKAQLAKLQADAKRQAEETDSLQYSLERARLEILKATPAQQAVNYEELLAPLEEQLAGLTAIIADKQAEIVRLQKLVHKECQERLRLQTLLGSSAELPPAATPLRS
jgi:chromosome segregation ATPase